MNICLFDSFSVLVRMPQIHHILWNHTSSPWVTASRSMTIQTYDGTEQVVFMTGP